jgi:hypothetical protein
MKRGLAHFLVLALALASMVPSCVNPMGEYLDSLRARGSFDAYLPPLPSAGADSAPEMRAYLFRPGSNSPEAIPSGAYIEMSGVVFLEQSGGDYSIVLRNEGGQDLTYSTDLSLGSGMSLSGPSSARLNRGATKTLALGFRPGSGLLGGSVSQTDLSLNSNDPLVPSLGLRCVGRASNNRCLSLVDEGGYYYTPRDANMVTDQGRSFIVVSGYVISPTADGRLFVLSSADGFVSYDSALFPAAGCGEAQLFGGVSDILLRRSSDGTQNIFILTQDQDSCPVLYRYARSPSGAVSLSHHPIFQPEGSVSYSSIVHGGVLSMDKYASDSRLLVSYVEYFSPATYSFKAIAIPVSPSTGEVTASSWICYPYHLTFGNEPTLHSSGMNTGTGDSSVQISFFQSAFTIGHFVSQGGADMVSAQNFTDTGLTAPAAMLRTVGGQSYAFVSAFSNDGSGLRLFSYIKPEITGGFVAYLRSGAYLSGGISLGSGFDGDRPCYAASGHDPAASSVSCVKFYAAPAVYTTGYPNAFAVDGLTAYADTATSDFFLSPKALCVDASGRAMIACRAQQSAGPIYLVLVKSLGAGSGW